MTTDGEITDSAPAAQPGPSAWLQISATLGELGRTVGQLADGQQQQARAVPMQTVLRRGGTVPTGGTLVIDMGSPAMGRRWSVRSLAVAPGALGGTLAGAANWYVGNPSAYGVGEWAAPTMATLPALQLVSSDQVNITPTDHLFVVITGGTAAQTALARAAILDFPQYSGAPTIQL